MPYRIFIILILWAIKPFSAFAQPNQDSLTFMQIRQKGHDCYNRNAYDSAFAFYKQGYEWAIKKNFLSYYSATGCLVDMGHCLYNQRKYPQAHQYYYEALLNARKYSHHKDLKIKATKFLHAVHDLIQTYDLPFNYPMPESFAEQVVYFDVDSVLWQKGDTALIRIKAGLYDGVILGKNKAASLYSIKNVATGEQSTYLGTAEIKDVGNNKSMAMARLKDTAKIKEGWQVQVLANVPESVSNSAILNVFKLNLKWKGNDNYLNLFNRRYFSYFNDTSYTRDLMDILRNELSDVVTRLGPDTVKPEAIVSKISDDGIFRGKNLARALYETNGTHVNYSLRWIDDYPFEYMGVPYRFSELYATWVIGNTPLQKNDVKGFILGDEKISDEMITRAKLVSPQVEKEKLVDTWIDEGLSFVDKSYWKDVVSQARLLYHYGRATDRLDCRAWADFFDAVRFKDAGFNNRADSLLKASFGTFKENGSNEGMQWINSVRTAVMDSSGIQINIQRDHSLQYDIVPSPNERYFATAGRDGTIKFWDINQGGQIKSIDAHNKEIKRIAYNPGGRYLASVSLDSTIKVWNTFTYGLMNTIKLPKPHRWISFSPDGKIIATSGYDSTIYLWEPFSGKLLKTVKAANGGIKRFLFTPALTTEMYVLCSDSALYSLDLQKGIFRRVIKGKIDIWSMQLSNKGNYLCTYTGDSTINIFNLQGGRFIYQEKIFVYDFVNTSYFSEGDFSPDEKHFVFMNNDHSTIVVDLNQRLAVPFFNIFKINQFAFNNSGKYFIKKFFGSPSIVDFSDFDFNAAHELFYVKKNSPESLENYISLKEKEFKTNNGSFQEIRFPNDENKLRYDSYGIHDLDLESGKVSMLYQHPAWLSYYNEYSPESNHIFHRDINSEDSLYVYDILNNRRTSTLFLENRERIYTAAYFNKGKNCLIGGKEGSVANWDMETNKRKYVLSLNRGQNRSIFGLQNIPGTNKMIILPSIGTPYILDAETGLLEDSLPLMNCGGIAFNKERFWLTDSTGTLYTGKIDNLKKWDTLSFKAKGEFFDFIRMSPSGKYLLLLDVPYWHILNASTGELVYSVQSDLTNIKSMAMSPNDSLLFIGTTTGEMDIYKIPSGIKVAKVILPLPGDPIVIDTNGYYLASKTALQQVNFSKGYRTYTYDQFDIEMNKPHQVLAAIGLASKASLQAYEKAYEKRLQKNGGMANGHAGSSAPSIIIHNRSLLKPSTKLDKYFIKVECYDRRSKLSEIRVSVNDVPLRDSMLNLLARDTGSIIMNILIPLTPGENRVKIYCVNKAGVSSYKEVIDIYSTVNPKNQKTWFVGLGVANYADTTHNLTYSAKDIRDLAKRFKEIYPDIIIDTLLNKQVTLKNIAVLKKRLQKITVHDKVIMAVTGHGLLSDSLDFYYATHDMNFNKPEEKGLPYDQLEQILNQTAARQKLLLIDACHSGLVDKENVVTSKSVVIEQDSTSGEINIKETRGIKPKVTQKVDEANTFSLMQNMFADFSNDDGIVVISAAGGLEYAFESARWRNGVFTYSILKGLEGEADISYEAGINDGRISVQELSQYVSKKVSELTKGKQQPTSRRENLEFDWIIK